MSDNHEGIIVILSSPSGAGKTSLVKEISLKKNYSISISHTTRKPRSNEVDSIDYFFINEEKFKSLISNKKFNVILKTNLLKRIKNFLGRDI